VPLPREEFQLITDLDDHRRKDASVSASDKTANGSGTSEVSRPVARRISPPAGRASGRGRGGQA
jgi:hypothetical protein